MMIEMKEKEWAEKYQLITNHLTNDGYSYETYGEELEYVMLQDTNHIWTELDGDEGVYIVAGYHYANRIQYYISVVPWESDDIFVTVCKYTDCDCSELSEYGDPTTDCEQCWGEGVYTEWSMD
jgi:hypothetical protein